MTGPEINTSVRLLTDVPELGLRSGQVGVVCSTWFAPLSAYEVEFELQDCAEPARVLLMPGQIERTPPGVIERRDVFLH